MKHAQQAIPQVQTDICRSTYSELDIRYDNDNRLAWYYMDVTPRMCCSLTLISEIQQWYKELADSAHLEQIRYIALASRLPGVFNLGGDLSLVAGPHSPRGGQRAHRPDCVEMTQQKLGARLAAPAGRPGMQHAAAEAPRHTPDDKTKPLEFACDDLADFLLAVRLV